LIAPRSTTIIVRFGGHVLIDMKVADFVEAVAAKTPTPGGGAVAALCASLGAALGIMAARYSTGGEPQKAAGELEEIKAALLPMVDQDAEAYNLVSGAYGLPKSNDDEKKRRKEAIQIALKDAAEVPLKVMMTAVRALEALASYSLKCNKNLASDLASGALLLSTGIEGAAHNVRINAVNIADKVIKERLESEERRLSSRAKDLSQQVLRDVEKLRAEKK
jgi:formiminotetrahydrofolate cyclodeaminase